MCSTDARLSCLPITPGISTTAPGNFHKPSPTYTTAESSAVIFAKIYDVIVYWSQFVDLKDVPALCLVDRNFYYIFRSVLFRELIWTKHNARHFNDEEKRKDFLVRNEVLLSTTISWIFEQNTLNEVHFDAWINVLSKMPNLRSYHHKNVFPYRFNTCTTAWDYHILAVLGRSCPNIEEIVLQTALSRLPPTMSIEAFPIFSRLRKLVFHVAPSADFRFAWHRHFDVFFQILMRQAPNLQELVLRWPRTMRHYMPDTAFFYNPFGHILYCVTQLSLLLGLDGSVTDGIDFSLLRPMVGQSFLLRSITLCVSDDDCPVCSVSQGHCEDQEDYRPGATPKMIREVYKAVAKHQGSFLMHFSADVFGSRRSRYQHVTLTSRRQ